MSSKGFSKNKGGKFIMEISKLTEKQKEEIEFNNGFLTAIGLFLAHERDEWHRENKTRSLTLYGATDHLYGLEVPKNLPKGIKDRIKEAVRIAFNYRLENPSKEEVKLVFVEFKNILKILK